MRKNTPAVGAEIAWSDPKPDDVRKNGAEPANAAPQPPEAKPLGLSVSSSRKRVQFDFSEEAYQRLEKLRARTEKQSQAEVVRNSLRVYEWLLDQIDKGYKLQLAKDDLVKEVELLL